MSRSPHIIHVDPCLDRLDKFRPHGIPGGMVIRLADADFSDRASDDRFDPRVFPAFIEDHSAEVAAGEESEWAVRKAETDAQRVFVDPAVQVIRVF